MRFAYIHRQGARGEQVKRICDLLQVSRSGYYAYVRWLQRPVKTRRVDLTLRMRELFLAHKRRYGSPRLAIELKASGFCCCRNTVAKLMRREGLYAVSRRKYRPQTTCSGHAWPVARNLLQQQFEAPGPNQVWLADLSYVATGEGWLYLALVMDLFSRRIVGWKAADDDLRVKSATTLRWPRTTFKTTPPPP